MKIPWKQAAAEAKPPPDGAARQQEVPRSRSAPFRRRQRRFRADVGTIVSAIALAQALLLLTVGYWASQRLVSDIGESAHRASHERVEDRVLAFLSKSTLAVQAAANSPSLHPTGERAEQTAELLWTLLQQSPELDSLYVADSDARMLMVLRYPVPAVRHIARGAGFTTETWQYKPSPPSSDTVHGADGTDGAGDAPGDAQERYATTRTEVYRSDYDPTRRSWFMQAGETQKPVWTQPYIFAAAQELGVTFAVPVWRHHANGAAMPQPQQVLVAAGDVSLGRLSEFVRQFSHMGYGDSALLSAEGKVLARSDRSGAVKLLQAPEDGVLGRAFARLQANAAAHRSLAAAFGLDYEGRHYLVQTSMVPATGWRLVSWVPQDQVLGGLRRAMLWALALVLVSLGLILLLSLRLSKLVTTPVENLSRIARRIGRLELDGLQRVDSHVLEIQHLDQALDESARSLKAFRKFVPVDAINQLIAEGHALAPNGSPRRVTVMFTDLEGFTSISESMETDILVRQLTEYFNLAACVFARHGGTIDKFIGDGIMVLWGAPSELEDAEYKACLAALELHAEMDVLNRSWEAGGLKAFRTRIGIHTGMVIAGVLGSNDRLSYTAFGDTINVASRIEGINKQLGTRTLISEASFAALNGRLATRRIEEQIELRGRQTRLVLYELMAS